MLGKRYNPSEVEKGKYNFWLKNNYFKSGDQAKPPFSLVIPPPNVTGKLHLGHAWDNTIQDVIARYKKAQGFDVLWLPGMDHAGIATQAKVEQLLRTKNIYKDQLGREAFLEEMWKYKDFYASSIREQWAELGLALDYSKERFTLDEQLDLAVRHVFVKLYEKGLIYQGEKIINVDPELKTALSNIEVIHQETKGALYYFRYPLVNSDEYLVVATTRPETMFGDVALFVNKKDERYKKYINHYAINPANGEKLIILADEYVDMDFGTGVMKCTPAHDPNDFALSEKYNLAKKVVMNFDATMNELANEFNGLDRFEARKQVIEKIKKANLYEKTEKITHAVGHSERSGAMVEPYLSKQWFIKMKPLAERALKENDVNFVPKRFYKSFKNWMENVEDWCISRQLWWGHRLPVYYHKETNEVLVTFDPPKKIDDYIQDQDVLDTWFSSALWPFATLGWPNIKSVDYQRYYPNSVMVTGYDIIFFWVSRMIFQAIEFTGVSPFKDCLIHGLVRDELGRKMTKSLDNGVDPHDVILKYGADALRHFLMANTAPGLDTRYSEQKVNASSNFLNKIWNSARYVYSLLDESFQVKEINKTLLTPLDEYLLNKYEKTLTKVIKNMEAYQFSLALKNLYNFVYDDFCSDYLEMSKVSLRTLPNEVQENIKQILYLMIKNILIMIAPFTPFIAEELYKYLPHHFNSIMLEEYPKVEKFMIKKKTSQLISDLYLSIQDIRHYKTKKQLPPNAPVIIKIEAKTPLFPHFNKYLQRFSFAKEIVLEENLANETSATLFFYDSFTLALVEEIDKEQLLISLKKEKEFLEKELARSSSMLENKSFLLKAPQEKIALEKEKAEKNKDLLKAVLEKIKLLK
ncbi:MAG: valine--tRNA ligase [Bacilli bacterium]|jgi:valyl-tRNA synthetase|nr:valine--tRNA ligase [Erysipelotrichia bacterium]